MKICNFSDSVIKMHLADEPFSQIYNGTKTVEVRLFDEKRKSIRIGDTIIFSRCESTGDLIRTQVVALHSASSFEKLFSTVEMREKAGFKNMTADAAIEIMHRFYTKEQEREYGVLGIEIKKE